MLNPKKVYEGRMILEGFLSYCPGLKNIGLSGKVITDYTLPARYYYSVWLRHLVMAFEKGLRKIPLAVAELGPGQSFGIGMAAILCGASSYYALDRIAFVSNNQLSIFHDLIDLFSRMENIPDNNEFKSVEPYLESYDFPKHIITEKHLRELLSEKRLKSIEKAFMDPGHASDNEIIISYEAPWNDDRVIKENSVDFFISQAVLEHIDDLQNAYHSIFKWLKPGGIMSHAIDFRSHGLAHDWNGHWTYSRLTWKLIQGNRPYLLNRIPYSGHIEFIKKAGFNIVLEIPIYRKNKLRHNHLAKEFKGLSEKDLNTRTAFIQAVK